MSSSGWGWVLTPLLCMTVSRELHLYENVELRC